jgi:6-pyruvoyltetrahydropterin/6-carboxytetrahydropterin synthase
MSHVHFTRVVTFEATHRYYRGDWSPEVNARAFGAHASVQDHKHRYECHVTVVGVMSSDTSMVVPLDVFDRILKEEVVDRLDGRHLNRDVDGFGDGQSMPTTEALAVHVWNQVAPRLESDVHLSSVRVYEDPHLYAEFRGEEDWPGANSR